MPHLIRNASLSIVPISKSPSLPAFYIFFDSRLICLVARLFVYVNDDV